MSFSLLLLLPFLIFSFLANARTNLVELEKLYNETIGAQQTFLKNWNEAQKRMVEQGVYKNSNKSGGGRFLQVKLKGPVNVESIRESLYDTQAKRGPPIVKVNIDEKENIKGLVKDAKEYELFSDDKEWDTFQSGIEELRRNIN